MRADFESILQLEQAACDAGTTLPILQALKPVLTPVVRIMYMLFESDRFRFTSEGGRHILTGLLKVLPDSKIVEDLHSVIRVQRNSQKNKKQTCHQIQELVTQSKVLEERGVRHAAKIDRETFMKQFKRTPDRRRKRRYFARTHRLPERWSNIMGKKNWGSLSEEVLQRGTAAFAFVRAYKSQKMRDRGVRVSQGIFAKFAGELSFVSYEDSLGELPALCGLCLGQFDWGILLWPIIPFFPGSDEWWTLDPCGEVCWAHIVEPSDWKVWHFCHETFGEDRILMRFESTEPLLRHFFRTFEITTWQQRQTLWIWGCTWVFWIVTETSCTKCHGWT